MVLMSLRIAQGQPGMERRFGIRRRVWQIFLAHFVEAGQDR